VTRVSPEERSRVEISGSAAEDQSSVKIQSKAEDLIYAVEGFIARRIRLTAS